MFQTIREDALDRLCEAHPACDRLLDHIHSITHRATDELVGPRQASTLWLLDAEQAIILAGS
jgi:hypothetical protein